MTRLLSVKDKALKEWGVSLEGNRLSTILPRSWDPGMIWAGMDLIIHLIPTPCRGQGHLPSDVQHCPWGPGVSELCCVLIPSLGALACDECCSALSGAHPPAPGCRSRYPWYPHFPLIRARQEGPPASSLPAVAYPSQLPAHPDVCQEQGPGQAPTICTSPFPMVAQLLGLALMCCSLGPSCYQCLLPSLHGSPIFSPLAGHGHGVGDTPVQHCWSSFPVIPVTLSCSSDNKAKTLH